MKNSTMPIAVQYCPVRSRPVRSHHFSAASRPRTEMTASTVYSGILLLPRPTRSEQTTAQRQHPPHALVGQQPADRDDEEEHQLLQRHRADVDADDEPQVVGPVVERDADEV